MKRDYIFGIQHETIEALIALLDTLMNPKIFSNEHYDVQFKDVTLEVAR